MMLAWEGVGHSYQPVAAGPNEPWLLSFCCAEFVGCQVLKLALGSPEASSSTYTNGNKRVFPDNT